MTRVGLVLGAGGVVGHAFHAGALAALAEGTGWDPRTADVIVGTSAGSVVGALLRAGVAARDLYEEASGGRPSWRAHRRSQPGERSGPPIPALPPASGRFGAVASPRVAVRAVAMPWAVRPGVAAAALLPAGSLSTLPIAERLRPFVGNRWPDGALWVCAVDLDDGRRVVFDRHAEPPIELLTALRASCAIPGFFEPVAAGGRRFVDGGAHSPTNADLLVDRGLDLVVISSPMSHTGSWPVPGLDAPGRAFARAHLQREERELRRAGLPALMLQPSPSVRAVMGLNPMRASHRVETARHTYAATRRWITEAAGPRDLVQDLRAAGSGAASGSPR